MKTQVLAQVAAISERISEGEFVQICSATLDATGPLGVCRYSPNVGGGQVHGIAARSGEPGDVIAVEMLGIQAVTELLDFNGQTEVGPGYPLHVIVKKGRVGVAPVGPFGATYSGFVQALALGSVPGGQELPRYLRVLLLPPQLGFINGPGFGFAAVANDLESSVAVAAEAVSP